MMVDRDFLFVGYSFLGSIFLICIYSFIFIYVFFLAHLDIFYQNKTIKKSAGINIQLIMELFDFDHLLQ